MDLGMLAAGKEALLLALLVSAPPLLAGLLAGLVTGVLQAATQVQEPSIGVAPRVGAVLVALLASAPWIAAQLLRFASTAFELALRAAP